MRIRVGTEVKAGKMVGINTDFINLNSVFCNNQIIKSTCTVIKRES